MVPAQHPNAALSPQHDGKPFCHKPCYATLFGPKGMSVPPLPVGLCPGLQEGPGPLIPPGGLSSTPDARLAWAEH